jgi:hypothetical protein
MTVQEEPKASRDLKLSDDDVAFLFSYLRDSSRPQPLTTRQLIDALRGRTGK